MLGSKILGQHSGFWPPPPLLGTPKKIVKIKGCLAPNVRKMQICRWKRNTFFQSLRSFESVIIEPFGSFGSFESFEF